MKADMPRFGALATGALWVAVCMAAAYSMMAYDFAGGRVGPHLAIWPNDTAIRRNSGKLTVVAFLHPRCVCSRATVKQIIHTLRAHPGSDLMAVVFVPQKPEQKNEWNEGEYVQSIRAAIPAAQIFYDRGGTEARRFGAWTSGTILTYDIYGREIFRGGITDRRGGELDNPNLRKFARVIAAGGLEKTAGSGNPCPVFGCPLIASEPSPNGNLQ